MSYHRFNNLREMFQGHLNRVLMKNVQSEDYRDRPCKCPGRGCRYGNVGRKALIVYTVTIRRTGKYYIDATSQTLKKRVAGHLQSARQFTLAINLAQLWQQSSDSIPSAGMLRDDSTNDRSTSPLEEQGATLYRFFLIIN
jgi:hypothetical protein